MGRLNNIRRTRAVPIVGYVKTHHRRLLDPVSWARVPLLEPGQRSSVFAFGDELYACYLRVGDAGPWASPWAGIVRLEVPAGAGRQAAIDALDAASSWLPQYASAAYRDKRAPVNLTPIAGLETQLRRRAGDARLALRAVRDAIMQLNTPRRPFMSTTSDTPETTSEADGLVDQSAAAQPIAPLAAAASTDDFTSEHMIGLVDGSSDTDSRTVHVVLTDTAIVQLDDVVAIGTTLPDGTGVTHYGIVTELRCRLEGVETAVRYRAVR